MKPANPYAQIFIDDGLGAKAKERYKARRDHLTKLIGHPIVLTGIDYGPGHPHHWAMLSSFIFQDPLMLYLTGINQTGIALVLDPHTNEEFLFIDKKDPKKEFWEGLRFGVGSEENALEIETQTGFKNSLPRRQLSTFLKHYYQNPLFTFWNESSDGEILKDHHWDFKKKLRPFHPYNIAPIYQADRIFLDPQDENNLTIANQKTTESFLNTLQNMPTFKTESDVAAHLHYQLLKHSHFGLSFPSIVASGKNATVLHYTRNTDPLNKTQLLLLDFGARWQQMHADISRTIPLSGTFNPLQKILYQIVLDAQDLVEKLAKPGITINTLNDACWTFINQELKKQITQKDGQISLAYKKAPHNVSHLLGTQVHDGDPFREYRNTPLVAGNCITNEPGIYGHFAITLDKKAYNEYIGIRIEDNLLITKTGCKNLSKNCPKTISEIEDLIKPKR